MPLTKEARDALPDDMFAVPAKRKLPLHDATHTRLAWDMVDRTQGLTDAEREEARAHIERRAAELGIDTTGWEKRLEHSLTLFLSAMSLDLPEIEDHPNRMPFTGIMTRIDTPSDAGVGGAGGKKTYLPRAVAEAALPSLLGMPIDFTPNFDGHDVKRKIGTIAEANIEGNAIVIGGFFYLADFPQECARIKAEKEALGFSYEIQAQTQPMGRDVLQIVSGTFTGAAVLYKDKAAYQSTSLAANAAEEITMTEAELKALLAGALTPISESLTALKTELDSLKASAAPLQANKEMREKVATHTTALRNCAASMEAAGIGLHSDRGHVRVLHNMAASMDAAAARGELPHIYRDHDWVLSHAADTASAQPKPEDSPVLKALTEKLEALGTQITDLKASAFKAAEAPTRKTLSADSQSLLRKVGLQASSETGKINIGDLDAAIAKTGLSNQQSMSLKLSLQGADMLAA